MSLRKPTEIKEPICCPNCGVALFAYTDLGRDERPMPKPGDLSICSQCAEPCEFAEGNTLVKLSEAKRAVVMANPRMQQVAFLIKSAHASQDPERANDYSSQLEMMAEMVIAWRKNNPDLSPSIQYNFQERTGIIAALQDAIDQHFISVNEDAMTMFKELGWLEDVPNMPTVLMVKVVLEHVFGKDE